MEKYRIWLIRQNCKAPTNEQFVKEIMGYRDIPLIFCQEDIVQKIIKPIARIQFGKGKNWAIFKDNFLQKQKGCWNSDLVEWFLTAIGLMGVKVLLTAINDEEVRANMPFFKLRPIRTKPYLSVDENRGLIAMEAEIMERELNEELRQEEFVSLPHRFYYFCEMLFFCLCLEKTTKYDQEAKSGQVR